MGTFVPMQNDCLGQSDVFVSPIGLGCWQFSQGRGMVGGSWDALPAEHVREIVAASLEKGVNWFDTAEIYGRGASEQALADAITSAQVPRESFVIADKWWPAFRSLPIRSSTAS